MKGLEDSCREFLGDETGAITIDWVALTAGILLLGIAVIFSVFSNGVSPVVVSVNGELEGASAGLCGDLEAGLGLNEGDCANLAGIEGDPTDESGGDAKPEDPCGLLCVF